jgi:hypothetical protein
MPEKEIIQLPNVSEAIKKFKSELEVSDISKVLGDSKFPKQARILNELESGKASYEDTRFALREILNKKVNNFLTEGSLDKGRIKQLANAVNKDIELNFASKGPEAVKARSDFNKYYKDYMDYIQPLNNEIKQAMGGKPVKVLTNEIFNKDSANRYLPMMFKKSDNPEQLAKAMLYQVGSKNDDFTVSQFYKTLEKIPQKNYQQIISHIPKEQQVVIDNMKALNEHLKTLKAYSNFSNTAQHLDSSMQAAIRSIITGATASVHGIPGALIGVISSEGIIRAARDRRNTVLNSPAFFNWANRVNKAPNKEMAKEINKNYVKKLKNLYPHANRFITEMGRSMASDIDNEDNNN